MKNSRFAAAAAAAEAERAEREAAHDFGGPPEPTNSRFSAAADYDRASRPPPRDMGPPPVQQNSRFAAAAAAFESERERENEERTHRFGGDRDRDDMGMGMGMGGPPGGRYGRGPPGRMDEGPPVPRNSRFAAAVAADEDYVPAELRAERDREEAEERGFGGPGGPREGGGRFGGAGGFGGDREERGGGGYGDRRGGGGYGDRRGGGYGGRPGYGDRDDRGPELPKGPAAARFEAPQEEFVVPAMKKKEPEPALPEVAAPLTLPGEDEAAAKARIEKKKREDEEKAAAEKKAAEEAAAARAAAEKEAAEAAAKAAAVEKDLLGEFSSGSKQGEDLRAWCAEQGALLPSVEKLVFHLLVETQSKNPDPDCAWAEPSKYGTALLSLVEENVGGMMEVLWGIQKFCDKEGFPKIGEEYLVQAMFRSMYKYDLADDEAFELWKEDESDEHVTGKMKAIIQTMDWFAWLEDDDEESEEDYEEEEEEEE